jgi:Sigma-70, region 4
VRYQRVDPDEIANHDPHAPPSISCDRRARREQYVEFWLPEPLVDEQPSALELVETADSTSMAFLVLESLSPVERAVFVLREAFDYGYDEIAKIVGRTPEHCRQTALRARRHVDAHHPHFETSSAQREELAGRFSLRAKRATRARCWSCCPPTACCMGTGAAARRRRRSRCTGESAWRGPSLGCSGRPSDRRAARAADRQWPARRALPKVPMDGRSTSWRSTSPTASCRRCTPSWTPTSWPTSGRSPRSAA